MAAGGRGTRDEGVIWKGDPGDFYMKVIAKKFRGVWHYGVITGVVTEWVLEDYGGATQWRAVFEDGDIVDLLRSEVSGPGLRAGGTTQLRLYGITRTRPVGVAGCGGYGGCPGAPPCGCGRGGSLGNRP